ncbi:MAG: hypothetical protein ABIB43_04205, partial [archaeon]
MRLNFRKISALASSALMVGMTAGIATAANFPAPFVVGGTPNVAIVYGSGAASSDQLAATSIQTALSTFVTGGSSTATGGDSILIEKSADKVNLGNDAATVFVSAIDDDDLPVLLVDGTYTDDDNTEYDYTQKVNLGSSLDITHFSDTDYDDLIGASDRTPTIGIQIAGSAHVLNYTLDFTTHPAYNAATLETTTMKLMGRDYYVLDVLNGTTNKTTFLDSANSAVITEGQTSTVSGRTVGIDYVSSTEVVLDVDGALTNSLAEGATYKLSDGTYVGIKDIRYAAKEAGVSTVEISVGSGKLEITHGSEVELNDESVEEIIGFLIDDSSEKLDKIVLMWTTDDEEFITPAASLTMPAFGALKLSMGAHTMTAQEETEVDGGSSRIEIQTTIKDGAVTIPILHSNTTGEFDFIGADTSNRLVTGNGTDDGTAIPKVNITFDKTAGDKYMVLSYNSSTEAESYYIRGDVITESTVTKVRLTNEVTGDQKTAAIDDTISFGNVDVTIENVTRIGGILENFNFTLNVGASMNVLYTADGMKIGLPYQANSTGNLNGTWGIDLTPAEVVNNTGHNFDSYYLFFDTEDKDENIGGGDAFNMTLDEAGTTNKLHVQAITTDGASYEIGSTDNYEYYVTTDVATKIVHSTGGDYDSATITYPGGADKPEFKVNLYLSAPETVVGGTGTIGDVLVTDSEVSTVSTKNLVVVGGSCINSAAATLVGGTYCGSAWTSATGVGSGQFLIKSYAT